MRRSSTIIVLFELSVGLVALTGCSGLTKPLANNQQCPPGAGAPASVVNPYVKSSGDSYERSLFTATNPSHVALDVRSIYVNPHGQSQFTDLGAGLVEVMSGVGTISVDGRSSPLESTQLIAIAAHQFVSLSNSGEQPLVLRLYLFGVR